MTRRPIAPFAVFALTLATALPAAAQVYPERIPTAAHARVQRDRTDRGQRDQNREEQTERTTKTVKIGATGELDVANISGDVLVTRGNGQEATIEIVKTARAQSAD